MPDKCNPLICPHLLEGQVVYCEVSAGGIFMPMPGHIEMFCRSGNSRHCFHYLKSDELLRQFEEYTPSDFSGTRRRYRRFNQRLPLFVDPSSAPAPTQTNENTKAHTIDLGLGGFQISTAIELAPKQKVYFLFDDSFSKPFWKGVGEVRWIKSADTENQFLAGISFINHSHRHVIAQHLEAQLH